MTDFVYGDEQHRNAVRPNARAVSSMSPTVVGVNDDDDGGGGDGGGSGGGGGGGGGERRRRPLLALGSPGSKRIISAVTTVLGVLTEPLPTPATDGDDVVVAVNHPRVHAAVSRNGVQLFYERADDDPYAGEWPSAPELARMLAWHNADNITVGDAPDLYVSNGRNAYFGGVHAAATLLPVAGDPAREDDADDYDNRVLLTVRDVANNVDVVDDDVQNARHADWIDASDMIGWRGAADVRRDGAVACATWCVGDERVL